MDEARSELQLKVLARVDLAGVQKAHNDKAEIHRDPSSGAIKVATPPARWSYGAHLSLDRHIDGKRRHLIIYIDLIVHRGTVGIGAASDAGQLVFEEFRSAVDGRTAVSFRVTPSTNVKELIVRNGGRDVAKATIEGVTLYAVVSDPYHTDLSPNASDGSASITEAWRHPEPELLIPAERPLVSLIMTIKNGMPYLRDAMQSLVQQTYTNFELVAQDCLSEDGSSEFIAQLNRSPVRHERALDGGIGDANNRAVSRCRGSIIGSIDADNLLKPTAIEQTVDYFLQHPKTAVVYGAVEMTDEWGGLLGVFRPGPFDFIRFIGCELVPPWSTSFFSVPNCGAALHFDSKLKTCADYAAWLALSHLPIDYLDVPLGAARLNPNSMTCRPANYEQFCRDKIVSLNGYLHRSPHAPLAESLRRCGTAGIYLWAAQSILGMAPEGRQAADSFIKRARLVAPDNPRLHVFL